MDLIWDGIREAFRVLGTNDRDVWEIALRSLLVSGTATGLAMVIGVLSGAALAFRRFPGRNLAIALVNTGMGLPPVVVGLAVAILLWRSGPLGRLDLIYTPGAMVIAQTVIAAPLVTAFTVAALGSLPPRLRPQLYALGASRWQMLWLVLQEARLPLLAAIMAGFGAAVSEVGASLMVGGNLSGETRVLTTAVVLEVSRGEFAPAIALSIILLVLIFLVNLVLTGVQQRERPS
ncbi:MAG: ABC transporter permease [Dehalococcoidia bacterium]|nr:ABC transporter permease [Dehalococcoidia bacterium]MDZ4277649.1 ABC transporter permease [Dehalococcoidia bacterium]